MNSDVARIVANADLSGWRTVEVEYGDGAVPIRVPAGCRTLEMHEVPPLSDPRAGIERSIQQPIGCPPLPDILRAKQKTADTLTVCITISDITRPVPYKGAAGSMRPLLSVLHAAGVRNENITILVGTGTHRPSSAAEKTAMLGADIAADYRVVDHECGNAAMLVDIGKTKSGTEIRINKHFVEADVKIATALVESHFMAGASGGRKAVCPALVSKATIERFHSAAFLDSPLATNLVLEGNPCHEEALEIAQKAGVDFIVNTVLNRKLQLVDVFSGHLVEAHRKAVALLRSIVAIPVAAEADVVLTHGGYVGINHYQVAKAAVNALPAVKPGGTIVLLACERDVDPIGPVEYRTLLHLLKMQGHVRYLATIMDPAWRFTKDQWEPQMWGKVFAKVGEEGLIYCSARLSKTQHEMVPGGMGWDYLPDDAPKAEREQAQIMVQNAVIAALHARRDQRPSIAFIPEGPYAVPVSTS